MKWNKWDLFTFSGSHELILPLTGMIERYTDLSRSKNMTNF